MGIRIREKIVKEEYFHMTLSDMDRMLGDAVIKNIEGIPKKVIISMRSYYRFVEEIQKRGSYHEYRDLNGEICFQGADVIGSPHLSDEDFLVVWVEN